MGGAVIFLLKKTRPARKVAPKGATGRALPDMGHWRGSAQPAGAARERRTRLYNHAAEGGAPTPRHQPKTAAGLYPGRAGRAREYCPKRQREGNRATTPHRERGRHAERRAGTRGGVLSRRQTRGGVKRARLRVGFWRGSATLPAHARVVGALHQYLI